MKRGDRLVEASSIGSASAPASPGSERWLLWGALALALSPVLLDLVEHWVADSWPRYSISFAALLLVAVREEPRRAPLPKPGLILLAVALAGQVLALAASLPAFGRPFAATAVVGMILLQGAASPRTALLALWVVPLPSMVFTSLGGLSAVHAWYEAAAALLEPLGMAFRFEGRSVWAGSNQIALRAYQSGLLLAVHMAGLAWYSALRRGLGVGGSARLVAGFVILAVPIQFTAIVATLALLHRGSPSGMMDVFQTAAWIVPLAIVLATEWRGRSSE